MERKLEVHKNMTLGEVTERAYKVNDIPFNEIILHVYSNFGLHWYSNFHISVSIMRDDFCYECPGAGAGAVWGATGAVSVGEI